MNVRLLKAVRNRILQYPERFDIEAWFTDADGESFGLAGGFYPPAPKLAAASGCGTTGCIAGWAVSISSRATTELALAGWFVGRAARVLLDLTEGESERLFFLSSWPHDLRIAYEKAKTARGRARVAARRIDRFIAERGDDRA